MRFATLGDLIAYFNDVDDDPNLFLENLEVQFLQNPIASHAGYKYIYWCIYMRMQSDQDREADDYQEIDNHF